MSDDEMEEEVDLSVIQKAIKISGNMVEQILKGIHYGSPEIRCLLYSECDYILECKVCRNLFRSLPNFVAHKRAYCQMAYQESETFFGDLKPDEETVIVQPEAPESISGSTAKRKEPRSLENTIKLLKEGLLGKSSAYKMYTKAADKVKQQKELRKTQTLTFEPIPNTTKAMKVTVSQGEPKETEVEKESESTDTNDSAISEKTPPIQSSPTATLKSMLLKSALEGDTPPKNPNSNPATQSSNNSSPFSKTQTFASPEKMTAVISPPKKMTLRCKEGINSMPWKKQRKEGNEPNSPERGMDFNNLLCLDCNTSFRSRKTLVFHYQNAHCGQRTFFPCPYCDSVFFYIFGLTRHLMRNHNKTKGQVDKMRSKLKKSAFVKQVTEQCQSARQQIHHVKDLDQDSSKKIEVALGKNQNDVKVRKETTDIIESENYSPPVKEEEHVCSNCGRSFGKKISLLNHRRICLTLGCGASKENSVTIPEPKKPIIKNTNISSGVRFSSRSSIPRPDYAKMLNSGISSSSDNEESVAKSSPEKKKNSPEKEEAEKAEREKLWLNRERNSKGRFLPMAFNKQPPMDTKGRDEKENEKKMEQKAVETDMDVDEDKGDAIRKNIRVVEEIWVDKQPGRPTEKVRSNRTYVMKPTASQKLECQDTKKVTALVNETELHCMHCDQEFSNVSNLRRHAIRHLGWKRYKCKMCKFSSYNKSECNTHLYRTHSDRFRNVSSVNSLIVDLGKEGSRARLRKKQQTLSEKHAIEGRLSPPNQHIRKQNRRRAPKEEDIFLKIKDDRHSETRFNISTRNSPREFDTRPYRKFDRETTLCTRKSSYPKKITVNTQADADSDDETRSTVSQASTNSKQNKADTVSVQSDEPSANLQVEESKMNVSDSESETSKKKIPKPVNSKDLIVIRRSVRANETGKSSPVKMALPGTAPKSSEEPELKAIRNLTIDMMD